MKTPRLVRKMIPKGPRIDFVTKDSGKRQEFDTGARRDTREGKGRFDLLSPFVAERLAGIFERGATKYGDRNWEKGMPISRFLDSAKRHINQFEKGLEDEDHLGQAIWNLCAILHIRAMIEINLHPAALDDLPYYLKRDKKELEKLICPTKDST